MKEKLYLTIPEPCHEDWNKMNPVEQGKFCAVCEKNVVDFTAKDDESILSFFKNYNGSACGRFSDDQLNRPIEVIELKPVSSFLKYAASLLLPVLMMGAKANAQQNNLKETVLIAGGVRRITKDDLIKRMGDTIKVKQTNSLPVEQVLIGRVGGISVSNQKTKLNFKGRVVTTEDGTPIAGVSVMIKGKDKGIATNENGEFVILLDSWNTTLEFSSVGFSKIELNLNRIGIQSEYTVKLSAAIMGMSEVIVVSNNYRRLGGLTGAYSIIQYSVKDSVLNFLKSQPIKIFPNPVSNGGTIQINFGSTKFGIYQIRLLNSTGQLFYSYQKQIASKNVTEQIHLNEKMSAGIYFVQVLDEKKKLVQVSKVIVQ